MQKDSAKDCKFREGNSVLLTSYTFKVIAGIVKIWKNNTGIVQLTYSIN